MQRVWWVPVVLCAVATGVPAQTPVVQGAGSYASAPPPEAGKDALEMAAFTGWHLVDPTPRPIPTNQWWTDLLMHGKTGGLYAYPLRVQVDPPRGLALSFAREWEPNGNEPRYDYPLWVGGEDFRPTDARVLNWGDWTLSFRLVESPTRYIDVTVGRGLPYVWLEAHGVKPRVQASPTAPAFDEADAACTFPLTADRFGLEHGQRAWGVYAPDGTRFERQRDTVTAGFSDGYLVVAALPRRADLRAFGQHAFALPRGSRLSWSYDPAAGSVASTWKLDTVALKGTETRTLQGWLAHHRRGTTHDLAFAPYAYLCPRGQVQLAPGREFHITWPFAGLLPWLPRPDIAGWEPARSRAYVTSYAQRTGYGNDTYWGGKDLLQLSQFLLQARELGETDAAAKLQATLTRALTDWYTWTPGEKAHFFARYPNWGALVGINESYGSAKFNDHHFHYGYFTNSTGVLAGLDRGFGSAYGPLATTVARDYANSDHAASDYPFMRTFDCWAGHSNAGGLSSGRGNNQESTSEAIQSWSGLVMLGSALGNAEMVGAGALGYAMESSATLEYWFDWKHENFAPSYHHPTVGILFDSGNAYATYFNGNPIWIWAIQELPIQPAMAHLVRDPAFAGAKYAEIMADQATRKDGPKSIKEMGADLGNVVLAARAQWEPDAVAAEFDTFYAAKDPLAAGATAGLTYWWTHALRRLGRVDADWHTSLPTSMVYWQPRTSTRTFVTWNPAPYPLPVDVYHGTERVGTLLAPPGQLASFTTFSQSRGAGLVGSQPVDGATGVSRLLDRLDLVFAAPVDRARLADLKLDGPRAPGFTLEPPGDPRVLTLRLAGRLQPGGRYRLSLGAASVSFTLEEQPPLALLASDPRDGQERVKLDRRTLGLTFNNTLTAAALAGVQLTGPGVTGLTVAQAGEQAALAIVGQLQADAAYTLTLPAGLAAVDGKALATPLTVRFSTTPPACPPNIFGESFSGLGFGKDASLTVDFHNTEAAHTGVTSLKIAAGAKDGTLYLFNGARDNGDERVPVDLSEYDRLEVWLKGDAPAVWLKVGHPVFDKAFNQARLTGLTAEWQRFTLALPKGRTGVGTLLALSVPAGTTVWLDDARYVK